MSMAKDEKAERLAAALRENLKRRKAQARGLDEAPPSRAPRDGSAASSEDGTE
ncbi:hypothetical protein SPKIRA_22700 [Sphingomonas paucimobilis]|jgi:hypothetical protein|uniref:Uncharacterized protein n=3 Tax=Sphingomonadaceae TaxID=41297 RepID=A0A7Y2KTB0_SPHPI|nr:MULTISPECIES: hypothetical protein [Sphingomonas]MBQ1481011.1 hypothetical protein [Sphingomonas sp.]MCM3681327.1 hypothetical protein [Sphingomonas paucimobilis]MDG5969888.1 hypothetical protein [Sphingomonas paucimobilis]NNG59175.1 hypothetical protein [Sphingomonas paucimobilis]QPS18470.1 hypothetical protein I6G65_09290 [Sphingomonas paucimobilis]